MTDHIYLMPRLEMNRVINLLPHSPSCRAQDNIYVATLQCQTRGRQYVGTWTGEL